MLFSKLLYDYHTTKMMLQWKSVFVIFIYLFSFCMQFHKERKFMQKRTMKTIWFSLFHFLCTLVMHSLMECFKCVHEFEIFRIVLPSKLEAVSTDSKPLNLAYCTVFIGQKKYFLWNFAKKSSSITSNKIIFIIFLSNEVYKIKVSYQNMFYAYIYMHTCIWKFRMYVPHSDDCQLIDIKESSEVL